MGGLADLVVSVLSFYSNDPNLNPAVYLFFVPYNYKKTKINEKEAT